MNTRFIIKTLMLPVLVLALTGCLKDQDYEDGVYGINVGDKKIVEIAGELNGLISADMIASNTDTTINTVLIRLASGQDASSDIQVTLALDPNLVADYNAEHHTTYQVPASSLFTIPSLTVTIPKGSRTAFLKLRAKPNDLFGFEYALGIKLVSVSGDGAIMSSNLNNHVVALTIRNKYDGVYTMTGTLTDAAVPTLAAKSPAEVHLVTTGPNTVYLHNASTSISGGKELFPIMDGVRESVYGSFTPEFTFDATNNVTTVVNFHGQPAGNTRSATIDPSGVNNWNTSKTLTVKWFMFQPSVISVGPRAKFDYVFTYVRPR